MRGNPQAASARLPARASGRRWPAWLAQAQERRSRARIEALEITEQLRAEQRRSQRSAEYAPKMHPWL